MALEPEVDPFKPALLRLCADRCAGFGDLPCWRLPEEGEPILPCPECLAAAELAASPS